GLNFAGVPAPGATAGDLILPGTGPPGTPGATGSLLEYAGSAMSALSMEERMTVCNMSIEAGARAGMIAPDATTVGYLRGRRLAPGGGSGLEFDRAAADWLS